MKKRFRDIIGIIEYDDLIKIKYDLEHGGIHLYKLISEKIKEQQKEHAQTCSYCENSINPDSVNNYTLVFGPDDFRKKSTFCGPDCLEYFIQRLKKIKEVN